MTKCPVCKCQMFILKSDNNDTDEFEGEVLHYSSFFQCPKCNILGIKDNNNGVWGIGMQRLMMKKKWYYYYGRWKPLVPLTNAQKKILKTPLNILEKLTIKMELDNHSIKVPFIFR